MSTGFYYDRNGSCKLVANAIAMFDQPGANESLSIYYTKFQMDVPSKILLEPNMALLMMGTTGDLQETLMSDEANGIGAIEVQERQMAIWCIRRAAGFATKTLVSIAPLGGYWGLTQNIPQFGWNRLHTGYIPAIALGPLLQLLPDARNFAKWKS